MSNEMSNENEGRENNEFGLSIKVFIFWLFKIDIQGVCVGGGVEVNGDEGGCDELYLYYIQQ